jgi:predicted permease
MNTTSPARRSQQERSARIVLAAGLAPVLPLAAVIVWVLGYKHVLAYVVAVIAVVVSTAAQSLVYSQNMKRARQL